MKKTILISVIALFSFMVTGQQESKKDAEAKKVELKEHKCTSACNNIQFKRHVKVSNSRRHIQT